MGFIKQDAENKNIIKKKKEEAMTLLFALPLLFLSNNDPVFCTLFFAAFWTLFIKFKTLKKYQVILMH